MSRSKSPGKKTASTKTASTGYNPSDINDESSDLFKGLVSEYLLIIERDAENCENTNRPPLVHPLINKYGTTQKIIDEAVSIYNRDKHEYNQRVEANNGHNPGCITSGGSRKKRGKKTRQNKKIRGHKSQRHKSQRHKSQRHKIYR